MCGIAGYYLTGHPEEGTGRLAAMLQTFPRTYRFRTEYMDQVCQMIGNAVPPLFAKIAGKRIRSSLEAHYGTLARTSR